MAGVMSSAFVRGDLLDILHRETRKYREMP